MKGCVRVLSMTDHLDLLILSESDRLFIPVSPPAIPNERLKISMVGDASRSRTPPLLVSSTSSHAAHREGCGRGMRARDPSKYAQALPCDEVEDAIFAFVDRRIRLLSPSPAPISLFEKWRRANSSGNPIRTLMRVAWRIRFLIRQSKRWSPDQTSGIRSCQSLNTHRLFKPCLRSNARVSEMPLATRPCS